MFEAIVLAALIFGVLFFVTRLRRRESRYLKKEFKPRSSGEVNRFDHLLEEKDSASRKRTHQKQTPKS